jgi:uncharacterized phage protein (TIGR02218 family)
MPSFLEHPLTTACLCWRVERRDGVAVGFTTHDRDLAIDGLVYRSAPGMLPSAVRVSDGFDVDNVDVKGALTSDAIRAEELKAGRWDGAAVTIFMTDWTAPGAERLNVTRGVLGEVSMAGAGFEAELRGVGAALDAAVVEQTSPTCRASLGDKRCRVDLAGRRRLARVVSLADERVVTFAYLDSPHPNPSPQGEGLYAYGRLRWIGGANSGLSSDIRASGPGSESGAGDGNVTLREAPAFVPEAGDLVELMEGCDRRFETCVARFGNAANFRGEPHLPGMDLLTRY